jgi:uncharacterized protein YjdB
MLSGIPRFIIVIALLCTTGCSGGGKGSSDISVTNVTLKSTTSIFVGLTEQLTITVVPPTAIDQGVTWSSNNPAIAEVDANGFVKAKAGGNAIITVTIVEDGTTVTWLVETGAVPLVKSNKRLRMSSYSDI